MIKTRKDYKVENICKSIGAQSEQNCSTSGRFLKYDDQSLRSKSVAATTCAGFISALFKFSHHEGIILI